METTRCAIYTRKSTEGIHDTKLSSCESQRQACEQWAQGKPGFVVLPTLYDDLGYSGGNTDRPAFQRLLQDIARGELNAVVVYDFDRLSRSTKDFPIIQEELRKRSIKTYSVTENYDGMAQHYGDLMLSLKMSIAQFQRMDAAARVRQKLSAMAERGMRFGGSPIVGYDIVDKAWVVNEAERQQALDQFIIYLKTRSISATVHALNAKGYIGKKWFTRHKEWRGGKPYTKSTLNNLLHNPVYVGLIRFEDKTYPGKHEAIVPRALFDEVQELMAENNEAHGSLMTGQADLWLKGKIRCAVCNSTMTPTWTVSKGKRYSYYECHKARALGKALCPIRRVAAEKIHEAVLARLEHLGQHPPLVQRCLAEAAKLSDAGQTSFETELERTRRDLGKVEQEGQHLAEAIADGGLKANPFIQKRLEDAAARQGQLAALVAKLECDISANKTALPRFEEFQATLARFSEAMLTFKAEERKELADLLIREVVYDEPNQSVTTTLYPLPELPGGSTPTGFRKASKMAEGEGFEPSRDLHPWQFSRLLPSTARSPFRVRTQIKNVGG